MSTSTKIWLIIGFLLIVSGAALFAVVMTANDWDFKKLSTVKYETYTHLINDDFRHLSLETITGDICFVPSEDETCKVVCYEDTNVKHGVLVQEDTLTVRAVDKRKWYDYIGVTWGTPAITVYLPQEEYASLRIASDTGDVELPREFSFESVEIAVSTGDVTARASASGGVTIKTTTGSICAEDLSAKVLSLSVTTGKVIASNVTCTEALEVRVSTGKTTLTDVSCHTLTSSGNTGDITLKNVIAERAFSIERSTGDVTFEHSDAAEIGVKTDTGDVRGSLRSDKVFITQTDTGRVDVPKTTVGGRCEITTDTGDIQLRIG